MKICKLKIGIFRPKPGQSLIETLLAVAVVVIIVGALVNLAVVAVKESRVAKNRAMAEKLAVEGIEAVRSIRDSSWSTIAATAEGNYALSWTGSSWSIAANATCGDAVLGLKRCVTFASLGEGKKKVTVTVDWTGAPQPITLQTILTNWQ